jgi:hypothetical protein
MVFAQALKRLEQQIGQAKTRIFLVWFALLKLFLKRTILFSLR